MTFYCRVHPDWEGVDLGKIHDHIENQHPELLSELSQMEDIQKEYDRRVRRLFKEDIFEIPGPNRLSDTQWLNRFHGRMPKLGNLMGQNETEK